MLCERCEQRKATVHLTKIISGEKTEQHLCDQCAKEEGKFFGNVAQGFNFNTLLGGLWSTESSPGFATPAPTTLRCDACGMTYQQFTQVGRFGCPQCYESFATRLEPLLRRIQSSTTHAGKVPLRAGEKVKRKRQLDNLRRRLQQAIASEQFEHAADLRDQIKQLEQEPMQ